MPPIWACGLRLALAAAILNLILFATGQKWPKGAALKAAAWYGMWEFGISMPLIYWGERVVPSGLTAVLFAVCPVVAMFQAKALGIEELNIPRLVAAMIAFGGVAVIFWGELVHGGSPYGLLAVFLAACIAPIPGLVLQRGPRQSAVGANAVGSLVGMAACLVISLTLRESHLLPRTSAQVLPIVYLAAAGSAGAFVLFAWLLNHWKTTTVAFLGVVVPVIAVVAGAVFRHETFAPGSLVGAIIVFAGVTFALRSPGSVAISAAPAES